MGLDFLLNEELSRKVAFSCYFVRLSLCLRCSVKFMSIVSLGVEVSLGFLVYSLCLSDSEFENWR